MSTYLKPIPRLTEMEPPARAVTVVSTGSRDVVYLDQSASIEIITEALRAWGLRVRAEREGSSTSKATTAAAPPEANWETTRPDGKAPTRLDNVLSPLWLPILERAATPNEPVAAWGWFSRAA
jgi:hypothetical protein